MKKEEYFKILLHQLKSNRHRVLLDFDNNAPTGQCYVCGKQTARREYVFEGGEPFPIGNECHKRLLKALKELKGHWGHIAGE